MIFQFRWRLISGEMNWENGKEMAVGLLQGDGKNISAHDSTLRDTRVTLIRLSSYYPRYDCTPKRTLWHRRNVPPCICNLNLAIIMFNGDVYGNSCTLKLKYLLQGKSHFRSDWLLQDARHYDCNKIFITFLII